MWLQAALILVFMLFAAAIGFAMAWLWLGDTHRKQQQSVGDTNKRLRESEQQRLQLREALEKAKQSIATANQLLRDERRKSQKAERELENSNKRYWEQFEQGNPVELQEETQKLKAQNAKLMREMRHLQQLLSHQQALSTAQPYGANSLAPPAASSAYSAQYLPTNHDPFGNPIEPAPHSSVPSHPLPPPSAAAANYHHQRPPANSASPAAMESALSPAAKTDISAWANADDTSEDDEELALFQSMIEPLDTLPEHDREPESNPLSSQLALSPAAPKPPMAPPPAPAHKGPPPARSHHPVAAAVHRDDLKRIKGIGPGIENALNSVGIYQYQQLANLNKSDQGRINDAMRQIPGHRFQKEWIQGARELLHSFSQP